MNKHLPQSFLDLISVDLPDHLILEDLVEACHRSLRFSIRVNTLKISTDAFIELMQPFGWTFESIPWCSEGFWVELNTSTVAPGRLPEHFSGLFYIQEASSMLPPVALFNAMNQRDEFNTVLDLAAAPGSKTTQIAALMNNQGLLVANEFSSSRIKALHSNLTRLGITNTLISHFDGSVHGDYLENSFDAILLDAPCSGEGTVRKDPDAFKNWTRAHIDEVSTLQKQLIKSAFMALKPGGQLVYSTCALNCIENQGVCQYLLDEFPEQVDVVSLHELFPNALASCTEQGYLHIWPQIYDSEGFFIAKFIKKGSTELSSQPAFKSKLPYKELTEKQLKDLTPPLMAHLKMDFLEHGQLYQRDKEIWFFPKNSQLLLSNMRFVRHGVKLLDIKPKQFVICHDALTAFGLDGLPLTRDQVVQFYRGQDLAIENSNKAKGEVRLTYQGQCIGLGKWVGNKVKNKLPRQLVNDNVAI
ncbi:16S rRNA (cytosine(1407)-C(5))-methyltransferase RsmF [Psychrobium sp. 1_MG-2023]|uniref:16S rRNA (cytosine(1407)-C(5))-methyltransferase RsmF n=1 Tax=Psychrobium sp. 1_MG-2023 TaxID=3062624 RepID=UPI002735DC1A|nr:16S rRNA (cytosine(1407)-C(5))-methyltransferase RsmF [Psychrobium sp. 1_MG-2023]MDP2560380.1 16S rRNA (cytosine(1407)-C(5))-methyltransferase RsmF [Psychrobium sp. 1_MG-2023]